MEEKIPTEPRAFFAAANSYRGFVSYFDRVFPSREFERIYVLKGGPGTGKSSFMKAVAGAFSKKDYTVELIFCSSDPRSLDGEIITRKDKKIAIIDGTAPHERDAVFPGAVDEIINLADHLDRGWLKANREAILSKSRDKGDAYKTAYNYLKIAGAANDLVKWINLDKFNISKAKSLAECILQEIPYSKDGRIQTRLVSSFGRLGEYRLDTLKNVLGRHIKLGGDPDLVSVFLNLCMDILAEREVNILHLPDALDQDATDGIHLPDFGLTLYRANDGDINIADLFDLSKTDLDKARRAKEMRTEALNEAKRWFAIASDVHFGLEDIYGQAMDFHKNELLITEKVGEIAIILENTR